MKTIYTFLFCFVLNFIYSQDQRLFEYEWKLEKLVTIDTIFEVPQDKMFKATFFDAVNNTFIYEFGSCNNLLGVLDYSSNQNFNVTGFSLPITGCEGDFEQFILEDFFHQEFIFEQFMITPYNPFSYTFNYQDNLIFLNISNSEGSIATFFDNLFSQEEFLKQSIAIYPNPTTDKLWLANPNQIPINKVEVYSITGQLVQDFTAINEYLDVSNLKAGVYFIKIIGETSTNTYKVIKN